MNKKMLLKPKGRDAHRDLISCDQEVINIIYAG